MKFPAFLSLALAAICTLVFPLAALADVTPPPDPVQTYCSNLGLASCPWRQTPMNGASAMQAIPLQPNSTAAAMLPANSAGWYVIWHDRNQNDSITLISSPPGSMAYFNVDWISRLGALGADQPYGNGNYGGPVAPGFVNLAYGRIGQSTQTNLPADYQYWQVGSSLSSLPYLFKVINPSNMDIQFTLTSMSSQNGLTSASALSAPYPGSPGATAAAKVGAAQTGFFQKPVVPSAAAVIGSNVANPNYLFCLNLLNSINVTSCPPPPAKPTGVGPVQAIPFNGLAPVRGSIGPNQTIWFAYWHDRNFGDTITVNTDMPTAGVMFNIDLSGGTGPRDADWFRYTRRGSSSTPNSLPFGTQYYQIDKGSGVQGFSSPIYIVLTNPSASTVRFALTLAQTNSALDPSVQGAAAAYP